MFLEVDPTPPTVPAVWGLGQASAEPSLQAYLSAELSQFSSPSVLALLQGNPGGLSLAEANISPGMTASSAAQQIYSIAQEYCNENSFGAQDSFGGTIEADCSDGGQAVAQQNYQAWLNFYNSLPAGVWNSAAGGYATAGEGVNLSLPVYVQAPAQAAQSATAQQPTSVQVTNTSRPGQSFIVGDSWMAKVTGPANSQVSVTDIQNGGAPSSSGVGSTDENGSFTLTGTMSGSQVGSWQETWTVGNASPATVSFTVSQAPTMAVQQSPVPVQTPAQSVPAQTGSTPAALPSLSLPASLSLPSWLTGDLFGFPVWGWAAGGLALLLILPRGR